MLQVYNEEDVVGEVIEHLISQGVELVVLDNGSTDNSYELCKKFADKGLITLYQYKTATHQLDTVLRILYDLALTKNPDWLIISDSDEFLETGISDVTLKKALQKEDADGYNLIQFDCFEFFMTNNDNEYAESLRERLRHYSWQHDWVYRAWKFIPGTRIEDAGGHLPIFPVGKQSRISPRRFILRHYNFRSHEQAKRKIEERLRRTEGIVQRKVGWHMHYDYTAKQDYPLVPDYRLLTKYEDDNRWCYDWKFHPYDVHEWGARPSRDILFDKDGSLKKRYPTLLELKFELKQKEETIRKLQKRHRVISKMFPEGTRRRELMRIMEASRNIISQQGFRSFSKVAIEKIRKRELQVPK